MQKLHGTSVYVCHFDIPAAEHYPTSRLRKHVCTGRTRSYGTCPACGGKGVSARFWCKKCGGEGTAQTRCQFRVKIPAGVVDITMNAAGASGTAACLLV